MNNIVDFHDLNDEQTKLLKQLVGTYITQNYRPEFSGIVNSAGECYIRAYPLDKGQSDVIYNTNETDLLALNENKYITLFKPFEHRSEKNITSANSEQAVYKISLTPKAHEKIVAFHKKNESKTIPVFNPEKAPETTRIIIAFLGLVGVIIGGVITAFSGVLEVTKPIEIAAELTKTAESIHWTVTYQQAAVTSQTGGSITPELPIALASPTPENISSLISKPSITDTVTVRVTETPILISRTTQTPTFTPPPILTVAGTPVFSAYPTSSNVIGPNNKNSLVLLALWKTRSAVYSFAISPDGRWVVSGEQNGNVIVRNLASGDIVQSLKYGNIVRDVSFSIDGLWLVAAGDDGVVKVWNTTNWNESATLSGHSGTISSVAFSPDGQWLVSGGEDKSIRLWAVGSSWNAENVIFSSKSVKTVVFSPDSLFIAVGSSDSILRIWSRSGDKSFAIAHINGPKNGSIISLAFSPDGEYLISGTTDTNNPFQVWSFSPDTTQGGRLEKGLPADGAIFTGKAVSFSPDGNIFVTGTSTRAFMIWRTSNFSRILPISDAHQDEITSIDFSPDGKLIITSSKDMTLRIWGIK